MRVSLPKSWRNKNRPMNLNCRWCACWGRRSAAFVLIRIVRACRWKVDRPEADLELLSPHQSASRISFPAISSLATRRSLDQDLRKQYEELNLVTKRLTEASAVRIQSRNHHPAHKVTTIMPLYLQELNAAEGELHKAERNEEEQT